MESPHIIIGLSTFASILMGISRCFVKISLTIKPLIVNAEPFSNNMRRKLARFSEVNGTEHNYNMAAYLIAQLGKNYDEKVLGKITGEEILELAIGRLKNVQYDVGGMVSFVETDNNK